MIKSNLSSVVLIICVLSLVSGCGGEGAGTGGFITIPTPTEWSNSNTSPFQLTNTPTSLPTETVNEPNNPTTITVLPTTTPAPKPVPHLYPAFNLDSDTSIETVNVIAGFFVAADIEKEVSLPRKQNLNTVMQDCDEFWEREFDGQMNFVQSVLSTPIVGEKNIAEYDIYSAIAEFKNKTEYYRLPGCYNIWMIYVVRDDYSQDIGGGGAVPSAQVAVQYEFWLDDEALIGGPITSSGEFATQYGTIGSAHEIGHLFGFPHPWNLPVEITGGDPNYGQSGDDVMAYVHNDAVQGLLTNMHLNGYMKNVVFAP